jgi:hypothetical protein
VQRRVVGSGEHHRERTGPEARCEHAERSSIARRDERGGLLTRRDERAISARNSAVPSFERESATITSKASGRRSCATSAGMT